MIPHGTKCDHCRLYWNATCELQRALYSARDPKELQQAYQEIQNCKRSEYHDYAKEADSKKA